MPSLVMISPAPVIESRSREVILDVNFVEGMKLHCQFWPGQVCCVLRRGARQIPDAMRFSRARLGFELVILEPDEPVPEILLDEATLVYCAADDMRNLDLPGRMRGRLGRTVFTVDQTGTGRIAAALGDPGRSLPRRLRSMLWNLQGERILRRALRLADGVQFNGFAVHAAYRRLNRNAMTYLDNRIRRSMLARDEDQTIRAARLRARAPLRLVWFGALDAFSGADELVRMAHLLRLQGVAFSLELLGSGDQALNLHRMIAGLGLADSVRLGPAGEFSAALVPHLRREADLFVSARRLDDPQPAILEAMGCGLPVLAPGKAMWQALLDRSRAGWASGKASPEALAQRLVTLDTDREAVIAASGRALDFAREHCFESGFARRMSHLRRLARLE